MNVTDALDQVRKVNAAVVAALGLDPATVVSPIQWLGSDRVRLTRLLEDGSRRDQEHDLPEGWADGLYPPRPEPTTIGDLRSSQIGRRIRIATDDAVIEGRLNDLRAGHDWIDTPALLDMSTGPTCRAGNRVPGRLTITVTVGTWSSPALHPHTRAWLLDTPS